MAENKVSKAQTRASRKWEKENPERTKYLRYRSSARLFIRSHATNEDLEELKKLIQEREQLLKKQS